MALAQKASGKIKFGTFPNKTYKNTNAVFLPPVYKDETKLNSTQEEPNHSIEYVGNSIFTDFDFSKKLQLAQLLTMKQRIFYTLHRQMQLP